MLKFWRQTIWLRLFSSVSFALLTWILARRPLTWWAWWVLGSCVFSSLSAGWGAWNAWKHLRRAREDEAVRRLVAFYEEQSRRERLAEARPGEMVNGEWMLRQRPRANDEKDWP